MALFGRKKRRETAPETAAEAAQAPQPGVGEPAPSRRTLDEQRAFLLDSIEPLRPFGMQVLDVAGLTLCEDIVSDLDLPPVTTAGVEGYGVRSANLVGASDSHPIDLQLVAAVRAGDRAPTPLPGGATVFLEEGAPVPAGVDAIVAEDRTDVRGRHVYFTAEAPADANVHPRGSQLRDGESLIPSGEVLNPRSIAMLAEAGYDKVLVRPRPRIVIVGVDARLVAPGQPLTSSRQRYDSTTAMLTAAAREDGATVYPVGVVEPTASSLRHAIIDQGIRADLILVAAGTDETDLVVGVLGGLGTIDLATVDLNGGTTYALGHAGEDGVPVLLLPGGPVSAFVGYHALVRPVVARLSDADPDAIPRRWATLREEIGSVGETLRHVPAVLAPDGVRPVSSTGHELAHDLHRANVLMVLPAGPVRNGRDVECLVLDGAASTAPDVNEQP